MYNATVSTIEVEGSPDSAKFKKSVSGGGRRGRCTFKKADVTRLVEAAEDAGVKVDRIEITIGDTKIALLACGNAPLASDTPESVLGLV